MKSRPLAIDLFAGAGGMSLGFEQAGFDVAAAVEIDPIHASTHHFNFPSTCTIVKSISDVTGEEILRAAKIEKRRVDVVFGGPPCQGFSLMGHRMLDDPRNHLVKDFVRIVHELEASYFVFENVKGLTVGPHRNFLEILIKEFDEIGYDVCVPWRVLDAKQFGVPQERERLFLLGAKRGLGLPRYPLPISSGENELFRLPSTPLAPTCRDALEDLPDIEDYEELLSADCVSVEGWAASSRFARELHCQSRDSWHFGYQREWNPFILTSSLRTAHTAISRRRFSETTPGTVEPISRFYKLHPDGQSNTLRAGTDSSRGAFTSPRPIHYRYSRCISVREMARLHGYPDWFRFHVTKWHGARQVGNSVPPPLARAIAGEVIKALEVQIRQPSTVLQLGETKLLQLGLSEAAKYWNVVQPIKRRDRKNGLRKRKQADIERERLKASGR